MHECRINVEECCIYDIAIFSKVDDNDIIIFIYEFYALVLFLANDNVELM